MRNLLATIGLAVVLFAGLGWYFKWYDFALARTADGKQSIKLDVDTKKIAEDAKEFGHRVEGAVQNPPTATPPAPVVPPAATPLAPAPTLVLPGFEVRLPTPDR